MTPNALGTPNQLAKAIIDIAAQSRYRPPIEKDQAAACAMRKKNFQKTRVAFREHIQEAAQLGHVNATIRSRAPDAGRKVL